jgi:hypothetical protein
MPPIDDIALEGKRLDILHLEVGRERPDDTVGLSVRHVDRGNSLANSDRAVLGYHRRNPVFVVYGRALSFAIAVEGVMSAAARPAAMMNLRMVSLSCICHRY